MNTGTRLQTVLRGAVSAIADIAREEMDNHSFAAAATCAELAGQLHKLIESVDMKGEAYQGRHARISSIELNIDAVQEHIESSNVAKKVAARQKSTIPINASAKEKLIYPFFYRDSSFIAKVGWSKSQNAEYEHRAPRSVVQAFAKALTDHGAGKLFGMESLLPLRANGEELPSYQAYLVLAWLRSLSVIERHGQKGYKLIQNVGIKNGFDVAWESLPTRKP